MLVSKRHYLDALIGEEAAQYGSSAYAHLGRQHHGGFEQGRGGDQDYGSILETGDEALMAGLAELHGDHGRSVQNHPS
jgi:hypothetical protein